MGGVILPPPPVGFAEFSNISLETAVPNLVFLNRPSVQMINTTLGYHKIIPPAQFQMIFASLLQEAEMIPPFVDVCNSCCIIQSQQLM